MASGTKSAGWSVSLIPNTAGKCDCSTIIEITNPIRIELPARMLQAGMPAGTHIGQIRLDVHDLDCAMAFYRNGIGFQGLFIMRRFGRGDLWLYYTQQGLAFNVWGGPNSGQQPSGQAGLRRFGIGVVLPDAAALEAMKDRLR
jgi:catechol 2,3-dioxygenase